jgi:hypothetical protein
MRLRVSDEKDMVRPSVVVKTLNDLHLCLFLARDPDMQRLNIPVTFHSETDTANDIDTRDVSGSHYPRALPDSSVYNTVQDAQVRFTMQEIIIVTLNLSHCAEHLQHNHPSHPSPFQERQQSDHIGINSTTQCSTLPAAVGSSVSQSALPGQLFPSAYPLSPQSHYLCDQSAQTIPHPRWRSHSHQLPASDTGIQQVSVSGNHRIKRAFAKCKQSAGSATFS